MQGKPESSDPRDVLGAFDISLCKGQSGATSSQLFLYTFFPFRCCSLYEPHDCFPKRPLFDVMEISLRDYSIILCSAFQRPEVSH